MLRVVIAVGLAALISSAALANPVLQAPEPPEPTTGPETAADDGVRDPDKVICRSLRPPTGTRVRSARTRQKVCLTKTEWERREEEAREMLRARDSGTCQPSSMINGPNDCNGG